MKNLFKNIFILIVIAMIVVLNIKTYTYKKDNPKLFDVKYVERPSDEYLHQLFDLITEKKQSYKNDWFINKGGWFGVISIRKKYDNLDYMPVFIHNMKALNFIEIEHNKIYCLDQVKAELGVDSENNSKKYFYFSLSWEQDSICRRLHVDKN
ncbi:hypothetical protein [Moraxella caprae]|nr:hypothetical protein [Moraxella caprae]